MTPSRRLTVAILLGGTLALVHALGTWPPRSVIVMFAGGAAIAFLAEASVVALGLLRHELRPQVAGVPLVVLLAWPSTVYVALRAARLVTEGTTAVLCCAGIAALLDATTDHRHVAAGLWTYTDDIPGPRFRGVPWWNYAGWVVLAAIMAGLVRAVG